MQGEREGKTGGVSFLSRLALNEKPVRASTERLKGHGSLEYNERNLKFGERWPGGYTDGNFRITPQNRRICGMKFQITPQNGRLGGRVPSADVTAERINVFRIINS